MRERENTLSKFEIIFDIRYFLMRYNNEDVNSITSFALSTLRFIRREKVNAYLQSLM